MTQLTTIPQIAAHLIYLATNSAMPSQIDLPSQATTTRHLLLGEHFIRVYQPGMKPPALTAIIANPWWIWTHRPTFQVSKRF